MLSGSCHLIHYLSAMLPDLDLDRDLSMLLLIDFFVSTRRHWFEKSPQASSQVLWVPGSATNRRWDARPDYFRFLGTQSANPRNPRFVGSCAFRWDVVGLSAIKIYGIPQPVVSDWILRRQSCDTQSTWEISRESKWNLRDLLFFEPSLESIWFLMISLMMAAIMKMVREGRFSECIALITQREPPLPQVLAFRLRLPFFWLVNFSMLWLPFASPFEIDILGWSTVFCLDHTFPL